MAKEIVCPGCQSVLKIAADGGHIVVDLVKQPDPPKSEDDLLDDLLGGDQAEADDAAKKEN